MNKYAKPLTRSTIAVFALMALVLLLATLAAGLIWCQPTSDISASASSSPVGTWVSADDWERGSFYGDTIVEFTDTGRVNISANGFTALYRYEDDTLYLLNIEHDDGISLPDDKYTELAESYKCVITGDHMSFHGYIPGIFNYRGRCDLIRISDSTGLSSEDISELY